MAQQRSAICQSGRVPNPTVRAIAGAWEFVLSADEPSLVPAGQLVLAVAGGRSRTVILDGRMIRLSSGREGIVAVDLTGSTGYHRIEVDGRTFWFGSHDAKLGLEGVEAMLARLRTVGTGWTGQALFSDGDGLRDVHVLYAWLDQWADRALDGVETILVAPRPEHRNDRSLSRRGGPSILLAPTVRLLRSNPRRYLAPNEAGILNVGGRSYDPLRVVVKRRTITLDTIPNRRAVGILEWLAKLCREVLTAQPDPAIRVRCRLWLNRALALQRRPLAQALHGGRYFGAARQPEEITETRYRLAYEVAHDLRRQFGWSVTRVPRPRFSYVERSDRIYQAFAATLVAEALGLTQAGPVLGGEAVAFSGHRFDLYFDRQPPAEVLRSWRAVSSRPDGSRPDLLLHERSTGRVALMDAKYRVGPDGGASEDSRKEVTSYLGLYGLHAITVLYPGQADESTDVSGQGLTILEVPLAPSNTGALERVVPQLLDTLELPPY